MTSQAALRTSPILRHPVEELAQASRRIGAVSLGVRNKNLFSDIRRHALVTRCSMSARTNQPTTVFGSLLTKGKRTIKSPGAPGGVSREILIDAKAPKDQGSEVSFTAASALIVSSTNTAATNDIHGPMTAERPARTALAVHL